MLYLCFFKPSRNHLRGFLIAAWAGAKIAEFSFPETSFHFQFGLWLFFRKPRVCGEKMLPRIEFFQFSGSPPHMRGKGGSCCSCGRPVGITPAYAGTSWPDCTALYQCRDHPRICREKRDTMAFYPCVVGSPPRMRGKDGVLQVADQLLGITPAYAGKSRARRAAAAVRRDYPRICGEKRSAPKWKKPPAGSPPRMRGKARSSPRPHV